MTQFRIMRSIGKSAWKLLENYCFLIKGEDERGSITGNTSCLSFLIWMWIVFWAVAAILWLWDNKSNDKKFACGSWQEGRLQSWVLGTIVESVLVNSTSSCRRGFRENPRSHAVMTVMELNFLLDQFKALFGVCFPKSNLRPFFPIPSAIL